MIIPHEHGHGRKRASAGIGHRRRNWLIGLAISASVLIGIRAAIGWKRWPRV